MGPKDIFQHECEENCTIRGNVSPHDKIKVWYWQFINGIYYSDPFPGIPVTASAVYSYSTDSTLGAILLTSPPITHERYYHGSAFKNWVKKNASAIFQHWPEVKKHDLWIITSTYATKKCAINMSYKGKRSFNVGFSAKAIGVGEAGPSGEWHRDQEDEGWNEYTAEVVFDCFLNLRYFLDSLLGRRQVCCFL